MSPTDITRILEKLEAMTERLAVLETKLDNHAGCDERLASLEKWRAFIVGIVAIVTFELQLVGLVLALRGE